MRNPLPSGTNCLISLGVGQRGGTMDRGSFHAKVLILFIKNGPLPLQLIKKNTVEMQEDFLRKFCSCVCYLQT